MVLRAFAFLLSIGLHLGVAAWLVSASGLISLEEAAGGLRSSLSERLERAAQAADVATARTVRREPAREPVAPAVRTQTLHPDFGAWHYACTVRVSDGTRLCAISQAIADPKSKSMLLAWQIARRDDGSLVSMLQTPTDVKIDSGLVISVDASKSFRIPFEQCYTAGCLSEAHMAPDFSGLLASAEKLAVTVFTLNGRGVRIAVSTDGLAEALLALSGGKMQASLNL